MSGSLQIKGNRYYVVTRIPDYKGKTKSKWISTGIAVEGNNKREAKRVMQKILSNLEDQKIIYSQETEFLSWIDKWMEQKRLELRLNSWEGYNFYLEKHIRPYFEPLKLTLSKLSPQHLQDYINLKLTESLSISTIKKHNAIINGALQDALKKGILTFNPASRITIPRQSRQDRFKGIAYTAEQAVELLSVLENDALQPAVILGLYYGLRKSEVLGLRWKDVDFNTGTLNVRNTITRMKTRIEHEQTKSIASRRTIFLIPSTIPYLQQLHREQLERRNFLGSAYIDTDHICVWPDGRPLSPDYVSQHFKLVLKRHNLPHIRFHDLRHTAGSLLLSNGLNVKQVQEFLGHEKSSTTLDIYMHVDSQAKQETALTMEKALPLSIK